MKCRDCENLIWSYDEGEWIWHCKECYCPDLDIERDCPDFAPKKPDIFIALSTLQAENEEMQKQLNEFSEFLCHMTGGLLSKTNYTAQEMISAAEDYQQKVCGECDLRDENEKLRAELEQVKRERDAAVKAIERVRSCKDCWHYTGEWTPPCKECQDSEEHHPYFKWRGQKED